MDPQPIDRLLTTSGRRRLADEITVARNDALGRTLVVGEDQRPDGVYDSIVSILAIASAPDPADLIMELRTMLAPDGRLYFVEPIGAAGGLARVQGGMLSPLTRRMGVALDRPVPDLLRSGGLTVIDIRRFRPSARVFLPGPFARGTARIRPVSSR